MSWTEWISVLKLSLMWQMKQIHDSALQKIRTRILNSDQWMAALKFSTQLRIQGLREIAIEKLQGELTSPLKMIELAVEYSIQPWLMQGYREFVMRQESISVKDEEQLHLSRVQTFLLDE